MADTYNDVVVTAFKTEGTEKYLAKLRELERAHLNLQKSINTAKINKNVSSAKSFRTQLGTNQIAISETRMKLRDAKEQEQMQIKSAKLVEKQQKDSILAVRKKSRELSRSLMASGLSFLFTGMAVKKLMDGIGQAAITTYNKINAGTDLANNAASRLAVGLEMIQYAIGEGIAKVLETLEPILVPMIEKIVNFIENNNWVIWVGLVIAALASFMMIVGQLGLFLLGMKEIGPIVSWFKTSWSKVASFISTAWTNLVKFIGEMNIFNSKGMINPFSEWNLSLLKTIGLWTLALGIVLLIIGLLTGQEPAVKLVRGLIENFLIFLSWLAIGLRNIVATFGALFEVMWIHVSAFFKNIFANAINWLIEQINKAIEGWNKFWGRDKDKSKITWRADTTTTEELDLKLDAVSEKLKAEYDFNAEAFKKLKESAVAVGQAFEDGLKIMTDTIGVTKEGEGWNNTLADLMKQVTGEAESATTTATDNFVQGAESINESADKQKDAADKQLIAANKYEAASNVLIANQTAVMQNNPLFAGFSFTTPA